MAGLDILIDFIFAFILVTVSALGASSLASFIGVLSERPQRGESIMGRSHCACGRYLKVYENIPVLGWLRVKGQTQCCKSSIPQRYVITEVLAAIPGGITGYLLYRMLANPMAFNDFVPWFVACIGVTSFVLMLSFIIMRRRVGVEL